MKTTYYVLWLSNNKNTAKINVQNIAVKHRYVSKTQIKRNETFSNHWPSVMSQITECTMVEFKNYA